MLLKTSQLCNVDIVIVPATAQVYWMQWLINSSAPIKFFVMIIM